MSFAAPAFLLGLLLVPLGVVLYLRSERARGRRATMFASPALLPRVAPTRTGWRRHVPIAVYALALCALVVALARPQATVAVPVEQASVVLVTDVSGSMQARDVAPDRLTAAREAADQLLADVPERVRVGLVAFNQTPRVLAAPTANRERVRAALDGLRPSGGTATGDALAAGLAALRSGTRGDDGAAEAPGRRPPAAIVLLSDGESTRGRGLLEVAREARRRGVPVHTVALGTPEGTITVRRDGREEVRPVPPDRATMASVADITGGRSFTAVDTERLGAIYERLGSQVTTREEQREITGAFAAGGLLLLVLGGALALHWLRRLA